MLIQLACTILLLCAHAHAQTSIAVTTPLFQALALVANYSFYGPTSSLAITDSQLQRINEPITEVGQGLLSKSREQLGLFWPFGSRNDALQYCNTFMGLLMAAWIAAALLGIIMSACRLAEKKSNFIPEYSHQAEDPTKIVLDEPKTKQKKKSAVKTTPPVPKESTNDKLPHDSVRKSMKAVPKPVPSAKPSTKPAAKSAHATTKSKYNNTTTRTADSPKLSTGAPTDRDNDDEHTDTAPTDPKTAPTYYDIVRFTYIDGVRVTGVDRIYKRIIKLCFFGGFALIALLYCLASQTSMIFFMFQYWNFYYVTMFCMILLLFIYALIEVAFLMGEYRFKRNLEAMLKAKSESTLLYGVLTPEQVRSMTRESYYLLGYATRNNAIALVFFAFGRCMEVMAAGQGGVPEVLRDLSAYGFYLIAAVTMFANGGWRESPPTLRTVAIASLLRNIVLLIASIFAVITIDALNVYQGDQTDKREAYGWKVFIAFIACIVIIVFLISMIVSSCCWVKCMRPKKKVAPKEGEADDDEFGLPEDESVEGAGEDAHPHYYDNEKANPNPKAHLMQKTNKKTTPKTSAGS